MFNKYSPTKWTDGFATSINTRSLDYVPLSATNLWAEPCESLGSMRAGWRRLMWYLWYALCVYGWIAINICSHPFLCSLFPWVAFVLPGPLPCSPLFLHFLHCAAITGHFHFFSIPSFIGQDLPVIRHPHWYSPFMAPRLLIWWLSYFQRLPNSLPRYLEIIIPRKIFKR